MFSKVDEGKGLVKVYWHDVRDRVAAVEKNFARIVDEINPDKSFPLYLAYYPYGALKGDTESTFFPGMDKDFFRISEKNISKDLKKNLGYSKNSSPLGMLLEKNLELFIDLKEESRTIPWLIYYPGSIFPFSIFLKKENMKKYTPSNLLQMSAGSRSAFMLPNIGCVTNHINLQRDFNIQTSAPKKIYDHWNIFKEVLNSDSITCDWKACIMYFSKNWIDKICHDSGWQKLKLYFHEQAWHNFEYRRNQIYYEIVFSMIQKKRNLKPNPYLADTARHLLATAAGAVPGYIPACNEDALPLEIIQKVFIESYGLKKYTPIIMHSTLWDFHNDKYPVYYSLQNPSTHVFSPKSRQISSTLFEMRELEHILKIFIEELKKDNGLCSDTFINEIVNSIHFKYYHNKIDRHKIIKPSTEMTKYDSRFNLQNKIKNKGFSADAPFVRGCISITN